MRLRSDDDGESDSGRGVVCIHGEWPALLDRCKSRSPRNDESADEETSYCVQSSSLK